MTGKSHLVGGVAGCLVGFTILQNKGLLIEGVNPLLQLTVMYPFAAYGGILPDMDHNWDSTPSKDVVSFLIYKVLHLTTGIRRKLVEKDKTAYKKSFIRYPIAVFDSKHRSWQTHSTLTLGFIIGMAYYLMNILSGGLNGAIIRLVATGLLFGVLSHLILDMLTPEGVHSVIFYALGKLLGVKKELKFHLVPKKGFFATVSSESKWEKLVRTWLWRGSLVLLFYLIYLASPYRITFSP